MRSWKFMLWSPKAKELASAISDILDAEGQTEGESGLALLGKLPRVMAQRHPAEEAINKLVGVVMSGIRALMKQRSKEGRARCDWKQHIVYWKDTGGKETDVARVTNRIVFVEEGLRTLGTTESEVLSAARNR